MLLPYYGSGNKYRLISDPSNVAFNTPFAILIIYSLIGTFFAKTRSSSALTLCPVLIFTFTGSISWIGDWIAGTSKTGLGAFADIFTLLFGFFAIVNLWDRNQISFQVTRDSLRWALTGISIVLTFQVGSFMNWTKTILEITKGTNHWLPSGSKIKITQCCTMFQNTSGSTNTRDALEILFSIILIFIFVFITPKFLGGVAVFSLGFILLANPLSWLVHIANSNPNPSSHGYSSTLISQNGIVETVAGLPSGWLAFGACILLIIQGIFMWISSFAFITGQEKVTQFRTP